MLKTPKWPYKMENVVKIRWVLERKKRNPIFCGKIEVNNSGINLVFGTYYGFHATCAPNSKFIGL